MVTRQCERLTAARSATGLEEGPDSEGRGAQAAAGRGGTGHAQEKSRCEGGEDPVPPRGGSEAASKAASGKGHEHGSHSKCRANSARKSALETSGTGVGVAASSATTGAELLVQKLEMPAPASR